MSSHLPLKIGGTGGLKGVKAPGLIKRAWGIKEIMIKIVLGVGWRGEGTCCHFVTPR